MVYFTIILFTLIIACIICKGRKAIFVGIESNVLGFPLTVVHDVNCYPSNFSNNYIVERTISIHILCFCILFYGKAIEKR